MFDYIDEETKNEILKLPHTDFNPVYRALHSETITRDDFLPTCIENRKKNKNKAAIQNRLSYYSVSLSKTKEGIETIKQSSPVFAENHKGLACGFTSEERGISNQSKPNSPHVDYYLYDCESNNPSDDFEVVL